MLTSRLEQGAGSQTEEGVIDFGFAFKSLLLLSHELQKRRSLSDGSRLFKLFLSFFVGRCLGGLGLFFKLNRRVG